MSIAQTREALAAALLLPNTPVIALQGRWGTGKTHLYRQMAGDLEKTAGLKPLYFSCFGFESIRALKSAVIVGIATGSSAAGRLGGKALDVALGLLASRLPKGLHVTSGVADLQGLLPKLRPYVSGKLLIVLDDVERASDFRSHEFLGFVTFLADEIGVRVLLILNKEKIGEAELWDELREKVVGLEVDLAPTAAEVVQIGMGNLSPDAYATFSERIRFLGVTNIRTIQHMRRVYDALRSDGAVPDGALLKLVPSIVLLVALHFGAIPHAPDVDYVLARIHVLDMGDAERDERTEEQRAAWQLLRDYGLGVPDAFEKKILLRFLRTGFLPREDVQSYVKELDSRARRGAATALLDEFFEAFFWAADATNEDLAGRISQIEKWLDGLDARQVSRLGDIALQVVGRERVDAIVDSWIEVHRSEIQSMHFDEWMFELEPGALHPRIESVYRARHEFLYPPMSLIDAIQYLSRSSSYGDRQSRPIEAATKEELDALVRCADPGTRAAVFRFFALYLSGRRSGGDGFTAAAKRFAEVCRAILMQEPDSRLAAVISRSATTMGFRAALENKEATSESS